ncbi:MAG: polyphosphate polymerase domain-containing protein [Lachnospiraceae bacterium]|nr:polyphosphate polymerase domain-containing protein [Lachnospiraceae bacterium]
MAGIFKRVEKKYYITERQSEILLARLGERICPDAYGEYTISNIYFDTPGNDLIRTSLEKPPYKEKLRLRAYHTPAPEDMVYLEMKKKWQGVVYKRRVELPYQAAEDYTAGGAYPEAFDCQILREIDHMLRYYHLQPCVFLAYDRKAYMLKENEEIRFTMDRHIRSRRERLHLGDGDAGTLLDPRERCLLEIKAPIALPLWFAEILAELRIFSTSFSKYGKVYQAGLAAGI